MSARNTVVALVLIAGVAFGAPQQTATQQSAAAQSAQKPPLAVAVEKPDLVVVSIDFKDFKVFTAADGRNMGAVIPSFTYKNQGKISSGPFKIAWEYLYPDTNTWGPYLGQQFTNSLTAGQSWTQGGQPADNCNWVLGNKWPKFRVRLDYESKVAESNETNNTMEKEFHPTFIPAATPIKR